MRCGNPRSVHRAEVTHSNGTRVRRARSKIYYLPVHLRVVLVGALSSSQRVSTMRLYTHLNYIIMYVINKQSVMPCAIAASAGFCSHEPHGHCWVRGWPGGGRDFTNLFRPRQSTPRGITGARTNGWPPTGDVRPRNCRRRWKRQRRATRERTGNARS